MTGSDHSEQGRRAFWAYSPGATLCLGGLFGLGLLDLVRIRGDFAHDVIIVALLCLAAIALGCLVRANIRAGREQALFDEMEAQRASEMARDGATGALLRRFFLDACEKRIRAADSVDRPMAYFAVDMDYLKILNDSLGHDVGDAALRRLVQAIRCCAGEDPIVGRLGGDEFAFLTDCRSPEEAQALAVRLHAEIGRATTIHARELTLSATIGIALLPSHTTFLSEAIQFSDLALYEGKKAGRNRATLFTRKMLGDFRQEQQIERELRIGLERGELRQLYLPVVDATGAVRAARAVMEWTSRWLGPVPAETFIRVAETTSLIDRVGEWSLRQACEDAMSFGDDLTVSVSVSAAQLKRDGVVDMVRRAIADTGIAPTRIVALVSRATTLPVNADIERRLRELRAIGIRISLDDLGAIVCDFERLRDFPVDIVRIRSDQIAHLGESATDNAVVSALAGVGKVMGLEIVADGVVNSEQLLLARTAGCDLFAGPYFAKAMTVDGFCERLAQDDARRRVRGAMLLEA